MASGALGCMTVTYLISSRGPPPRNPQVARRTVDHATRACMSVCQPPWNRVSIDSEHQNTPECRSTQRDERARFPSQNVTKWRRRRRDVGEPLEHIPPAINFETPVEGEKNGQSEFPTQILCMSSVGAEWWSLFCRKGGGPEFCQTGVEGFGGSGGCRRASKMLTIYGGNRFSSSHPPLMCRATVVETPGTQFPLEGS